MTTFAPNSIGRQKYGVAKVLSINNGASAAFAKAANFSISNTRKAGLAMVSAKIAFVFGRIAFLSSSSGKS